MADQSAVGQRMARSCSFGPHAQTPGSTRRKALFMAKAVKLSAALLLGFAAWAAPAAATAVGVNSPDGGARAAEINNWHNVRVCDQKQDGWGVYSRFNTPSVPGQRVSEYGGAGQCNTSANLPITSFNACTDKTGQSDSCSGMIHKP
jgi:hypothetical protein